MEFADHLASITKENAAEALVCYLDKVNSLHAVKGRKGTASELREYSKRYEGITFLPARIATVIANSQPAHSEQSIADFRDDAT